MNHSVHILALHYLAQDGGLYTNSLGTRWEMVCRNHNNLFEETVREVIASAATWVSISSRAIISQANITIFEQIYLVYEVCAHQGGTLPIWDPKTPIAHLFELRPQALHVYFRVLHTFGRAEDQHAAHVAHFFEGIMISIPRM